MGIAMQFSQNPNSSLHYCGICTFYRIVLEFNSMGSINNPTLDTLHSEGTIMSRLTLIISAILFVVCAYTCIAQTGGSSSGSSSYGIPIEIVEKLKWLSEAESPFTVPVFDTRAFATTMVSVTSDKNVAALYTELTKIDGTLYKGRHTDFARITDSGFHVDLTTSLKNGPVFVSSAMEEKWNIYFFDNILYFVRSWTGDLFFRAEVSILEKELSVSRVEYNSRVCSKDFDATRAVYFLIKSHIFRKPAIAPIPNEISDHKVEIAMYLFGMYGCVAYFASRENTVDARLKE